jgi:pimeloyl-ACP methyl ester carboxylesterase
MPADSLPAGLLHHYDVVNGIRMHWVEAGTGSETILFLHGFPEQWYSWRHQIATFAPDYRVVAPDQRGYNETEAQGPYDTDTLQQDVLELIGVLGWRRSTWSRTTGGRDRLAHRHEPP